MRKFSVMLFVAFALGLFANRLWAQPAQPPVVAGDTTHSLESGGRTRSYLLHLPPANATRNPLPLVILLHGGGGNGAGAARMSNMSVTADREGFAVVYPMLCLRGTLETAAPTRRTTTSTMWDS